MTEDKGEIVLYENDDGLTVDVNLINETVWLSRKDMALLFGRDYKTIAKHVNVFKEGELHKGPVVAKFATTGDDVKTIKLSTTILM